MARKMIFGDYDTHRDGPWTLQAGWALTPPQYRAQFIEVPGRDGDLDLSTALTDGEPRYGSRTLTATFERSDGTRLQRENAINEMVNWLDGWSLNIQLPDDETHYLTGRVSVAKNFNDLAHASVTVTAICDPWRYAVHETVAAAIAASTAKPVLLPNAGRRSVVPKVEVTGTNASINLVFGSASWVLTPGVYELPDLIVPRGGVELTCKGSGSVRFTYREAVL